jgi:hypothetical protein
MAPVVQVPTRSITRTAGKKKKGENFKTEYRYRHYRYRHAAYHILLRVEKKLKLKLIY